MDNQASTKLLFASLFLKFYLASKLCHMAMVELIIMIYGCGRVVVLLSIFFYQNSQKGTVRCEMKKENGISLCILSVEGPQLSSASGLLSEQSKLWFVDTTWDAPHPLPINETLKWLTLLPILMQESVWWWQGSIRLGMV